MPDALDRKCPNAPREWNWQWVFPATRSYTDPDSGEVRRHHLHETVIQRLVRRAAIASRITKNVSPHTLRHYAESPVMPSRPPSHAGIARIPGSLTYPTRHSQRLCRKARSLSSGRKRVGRGPVGVVLASARSLSWRCLLKVRAREAVVQFVPEPALSEVPVPGTGAMDCPPSGACDSHEILPRGVYPP